MEDWAMTKTTEGGGGRIGTVVRIIGWGGIAGLLLLPAIAMRFTDEVQWTPSDFVFAGAILGGAGVIAELIAWKSGNLLYRAGAGVALLASVLLIWVTGAVGVIGDEGEAANLLYLGVIAMAFIGAVIARFQAGGMARAMAVAGLTQTAIAAAALVMRWGSAAPIWPWDIIGATVVFALLWLTSAVLFRQAGANTASITRR